MSQEKMMQFQVLQNNLKQLEEREKLLIQGIDDLERTKFALNELGGLKGKAYIPVGANNFIEGSIEDSENVLITIGAGIAVKRPRKEALEVNDKRIKEFNNEAEKTLKEMKVLGSKLSKLQAELRNK
ncbi:MAG: prefoldin subunit alpha [Nanoarchaeota archaeon]|nr:prefoldin subunit alpha [Nanoarchaeota archaeon]